MLSLSSGRMTALDFFTAGRTAPEIGAALEELRVLRDSLRGLSAALTRAGGEPGGYPRLLHERLRPLCKVQTPAAV